MSREDLYCNNVHLGEKSMAIQTTYTKARANLAKLLDAVAQNREIVIIERRGSENVAMVAADELSSLLETAHLLRSPKNAQRLLTALVRALKHRPALMPLEKLRREVGLDRETA
jgi:antitoxin YefM